MRFLSFVVVCGLAFGLIGCGNTTEVKGTGDKALKLTTPAPTNIEQGTEKKITVKIARTKFDDPVTLTFSDLPDGVKIEESDTKLDKGVNEKTFTLKAEEKAPVKDGQKAKVKASGGGMTAGPEEFTINVTPKK